MLEPSQESICKLLFPSSPEPDCSTVLLVSYLSGTCPPVKFLHLSTTCKRNSLLDYNYMSMAKRKVNLADLELRLAFHKCKLLNQSHQKYLPVLVVVPHSTERHMMPCWSNLLFRRLHMKLRHLRSIFQYREDRVVNFTCRANLLP